jgi:hypothetical protein
MTGPRRHIRTDAGGVAGQSGANYQARVAAWLGVRMLAGSPVGHGLRDDVRLAAVRCQADSPVDDIVASTNEQGLLFIQAKRRISAVTDRQGSEFDEIVTQFVRQALAMEDASGNVHWRRPLEPARDRLVLVTSSDSSRTLGDLARVLDRFRGTPGAVDLETVANNAGERIVAAMLKSCGRHAWSVLTGQRPTEEQLASVFRGIYVQFLDLDEDQVGSDQAREILRVQLLQRPAEAGLARLDADGVGASSRD